MQTKIQKAAAAAKATGLEHFLLATKTNETSITVHFENISIKHSMEIIIAGFHQLVQMDVEKNPQFSDQVKQVYVDLQKDFDAAIRKFNANLNNLNKAQSKTK